MKEALIQAAIALIGERGPGGFTFAEAARRAGVSPAAPYRHFRHRDDLLASVARLGFEKFGVALAAAWDEGRPSPLKAFARVGDAYLAFARNEPALYAAMFEAGLSVHGAPALDNVSDRAFDMIRAASERIAEAVPKGAPRPPSLMVALHMWSMAHGVASLFARNARVRAELPMTPEELLRAQVLVYFRGLGITP